MFKSGVAAIVGKPNTGKSTLLNLLIGEKIAIVSHKPQATRKSVKGILTSDNYQIIFTDTPGAHKSLKKLSRIMIGFIDDAVDDADAVVVVTDNLGTIDETIEKYLSAVKNKEKKAVLIINKTDLMDNDDTARIEKKFTEAAEFDAVLQLSLINDADAKSKILDAILNLMSEGPKYYDEDIISTETERFIVAEIIREKLMNGISEEIPYSTAVTIDEMKYRQEKKLYYIKAVIIVERLSHKKIIIGRGGQMIKNIGQQARVDVEHFLNSKVFLDLWIKHRENWTKKEYLVKEYIDPRY